jgi:TolB protein
MSVGLFALDATIKIEKDVDQRAIVTISAKGDTGSSKSAEIAKILESDLKISGHFLVRGKESAGDRSIDYHLQYEFKESMDGAILEIKVVRGADSELFFSRRYRIPVASRYPFLVHRAISEFNDKAGFSSIDWINRYVLIARYTAPKKSAIILADYTFHYLKTVIKGGLNLFPIWGDDKQRSFYYTSYDGERPTLYKLDIYSGTKSPILSSQGMLVCSDVSSDGKRLLLTMAPEGQPDIYEYTPATGEKRRLTQFSGIDVGGKYADGEREMIFISNRMGYPNIYKKSLMGGDIEQLVFHGKNNNSCDTSGKRVVYSSREGRGLFNLYLTYTDGSGTRPLTTGGKNRFPRFSPDGDTVLYIEASPRGSAVGYIGLTTNISMLFPLGMEKIQSIDW